MAPVLDLSAPSVRLARPVIDFDQARAIAEEHGTPTLVISRSVVRRNYEAMKSAMPNVELFYAAKSNPAHPLLRTLCESGSSCDVCSWGEMKAALDAGFTGENMIHTHPCKTESNITQCWDAGMRWFVIDCVPELDKMARWAPDANLILRLAATSQSSLINLSAKFGCDPDDAMRILREARRRGLNVKGISFHVGSQCLNPADYERMLYKTREVWDEATAEGFELEMLDVGGGFPAPYRRPVMSLEAFCHQLDNALTKTFGDLNVRIIAEPGRGISAETMTLVTKVLGKNKRGGKMWYFIDDGVYGSFSGKLFDHADFELVTENAIGRQHFPCVVAGPTCDSHDIVSEDQELPDLEIGELLLVPTMGSYTNASASPFNGLDVAKIIEVE